MTSHTQNKIEELVSALGTVIIDKKEQIEMIFSVWLMGGHVLLEDLPGTGKTVLAKSFAKATGIDFGRVQFTPDLLPNDILGTTIYDQENKRFIFRKGAIFSTFFLGDELNRATPRTQSALLEAMAERQVTVENKTAPLHELFLVMATQNPIESHGTFPLPEAQLDRFTIKISLGFIDGKHEEKMIRAQLEEHPLKKLGQVMTPEIMIELKGLTKKVRLDDEVLAYLLSIIDLTRKHPDLKYGVSPRASLDLSKLSQAFALVSGRDYVIPGDIYKLAPYVLSHRLHLKEEALFEGKTCEKIISQILSQVPTLR